MLIDSRAVTFDRRVDDSYVANRPTANWQVIFRVKVNERVLGYCRETKCGKMTKDQIKSWAEQQCCTLQQSNGREFSAIIERW